MHEVLVNRLGGLSLPRKSVVRLTDRPDITLYVYRGRKTTIQQQQQHILYHVRISSLGALINTAKFKVQVHYHFCFELERILFSDFEL